MHLYYTSVLWRELLLSLEAGLLTCGPSSSVMRVAEGRNLRAPLISVASVFGISTRSDEGR